MPSTLTTSQLRTAWAPACTGPWAQISLHGGAAFGVRPAIVEAVKALNECFKKWDYKCTPPDCGAYNCRKITGGTGYSLHAFSIALDINWQSNPYGPQLVTDMPMPMIEAVEAIRTTSGKVTWRWGGRYSGNKDAMHFEIVCSPADLATGINWSTVPGANPTPAVSPIMKMGSTGPAVAFYQALLNIVTPFAKLGDQQLLMITDPAAFFGRTEQRTKEFQAWARAQQVADGVKDEKTLLDVDGLAGPQTAAALARWVPIAQKG